MAECHKGSHVRDMGVWACNGASRLHETWAHLSGSCCAMEVRGPTRVTREDMTTRHMKLARDGGSCCATEARATEDEFRAYILYDVCHSGHDHRGGGADLAVISDEGATFIKAQSRTSRMGHRTTRVREPRTTSGAKACTQQ